MFGNDITMCEGKNCPLRNTCYRYLCKPDPYWQSYFMTVPYDNKTKTCDSYWEYKQKKEHQNEKRKNS